MCLFSFSGYEGAAHMSEETTNAALSAPKGILWTCIATAVTGFVYILGLLYAANDQLVDSGGNSLSAIEIFQNAFTSSDGTTVNIAGALGLSVLLIINLFFAGFSSMTVTTRIGFAMARDGAFPFSHFWYKVSSKNKVPYMMIIMVFFIDSLLCLFPLINPIAWTAITSITVIGYQVSYAIPILLRVTCSRKTFK
jgi:amino acid transporter